jgi:hypothetical protein
MPIWNPTSFHKNLYVVIQTRMFTCSRMVDSLILLVLYVDDLLITSYSTSMIVAVKRIIHDRFLMMNMGPLHFFLGLEIIQDASCIKLSQAKYA